MTNMPCVSYSLSNMIINLFKKSNEVFTISTFTVLPKFPSIENRNRHLRGLEEVRGEQLALPPRPRLLFARGGTTENSRKLRLKFLKSAGSTPKKGKVQEWAKRN